MQLAKSITLRGSRHFFLKFFFSILSAFIFIQANAQDNSPYSRYGLGDLYPTSNISTRAMGGIAAGFADPSGSSINFTNPASYSNFITYPQLHSKKIQGGRVIFDVGINFDNRTLVKPNTTQRSSSSDAVFSYLQVGVPINKNWGLSFGLRPLSRISYNITQLDRIKDPVTGNAIDSTFTQYKGSGGSYLPSIGTGFAIGRLSLGVNVGYLFGQKTLNVNRSFIDSIQYNASSFTTQTSFGNIYFNGGLQYLMRLPNKKYLRLGASGSWQQNLRASQDVNRKTYILGTAGEQVQLDSVYNKTGIEGTIQYPSNIRFGFTLGDSARGWLVGVDYVQNKWSQYRYYGQIDSVQDNWQINVGGQFYPKAGDNYFSHVAYRFGFHAGPDYIKVNNNLPVMGASFGLGLPIFNRNRLSPNQFSLVNLTFEYMKRGNNQNIIKENTFRFSVGLNLTDLWFGKRKYE